jgi:hypothetical protein
MAHWQFDGDLACSVDPGNDGVPDSNELDHAAGIDGLALDLSDHDTSVAVGNHIYNYPDMTLSLWFNLGYSNGGMLVAADDESLYCHVDPNGLLFNYSGGFVSVDEVFDPNQWYHMVALCDSDQESFQIYLDGRLMAEGTGYGDLNVGPLHIGSFDQDEIFPGLIDDVRIYNYAISCSETAMQYYELTGQSGCCGTPATETTGDCIVNMVDVRDFCHRWLETEQEFDFSEDGYITYGDFDLLAETFLHCYLVPECP